MVPRLRPVKVLNKNGLGWSTWIIAGIGWVAANVDTIEVASISLRDTGFSRAEHDAIQGAVDLGVAFAIAAPASASSRPSPSSWTATAR